MHALFFSGGVLATSTKTGPFFVFHHSPVGYPCDEEIACWSFNSFTLLQNLLIASGGKPLLLNAVKVNNLGSSQSL